MASRTYYYIKPKPEANITFGKPEPMVLNVSSAGAGVLTPAKPLGSIMDFSFAPEAELHEAHPVIKLAPLTAWMRVGILAFSIISIYFGGFAISQAAVSIKGDITGLTDKGVTKLATAATLMGSQDFTGARDNFRAAENLFSTAQKEILDLGQTNLYLSGLGGSNFQVIAGQKLIDAGLNLAQSGQLLITAISPAKEYLNQVNSGGGDAKEYPKQIAALLTDEAPVINQALVKVTKANALLSSLDEKNLDAEYARALVDAKAKTADLQTLVGVLATVSRELPRLLGFNSPKIITVLNQNNNELRATGGFLGSIATVKLYKGEIQSVDVDITQRIDGQNPHPSLELPKPLQAVAHEGTFGTRDSNYYSNFATSAKTFETLREEARGGSSDIIIAINPTIIEDLLTIVGPIELPGKNLTLDASNFVTASQDQIEIKDQKKENPKEIFNEFAPLLMDKVLHASGDQLKQINAAFVERLKTKDIMIYAKNKNFQEALENLNFAGTMPTVEGDFLSVVRTNLGATKSSQTVKQEISHVANISLDGQVEDMLNLTYTHQGTYEFPNGDNKDYIRIFVPLGSEILSLSGQDSGTDYEVYEEDGKTVFAAWLTTKPGETKQISVSYRPKMEAHTDYRLYVSRQSGAGNTSLESTVRISPALLFDEKTLARTRTLYTGALTNDVTLSQPFIRSL